MAFILPLALPLRGSNPLGAEHSLTSARAHPSRPRRATLLRAALEDPVQEVSAVAPSPAQVPIYGSAEDVCTFGKECELSSSCVSDSPALSKLSNKYVLPMRENNTQVFFDNSVHESHTLLLIFTTDRHGLVLDVVSVLKALNVRVHRSATSENDSLRLIMSRIEGELVSIKNLSLSLENCIAFWLTDEPTGEKIFDDGVRLAQLSECLKIELDAPYPRPRPAFADRWHRITVQKNRADRYTVFSIQTPDRPRLLAAVSDAFDRVGIDVASASVKTSAERVENHFFVTKRGFKQPLETEDIEISLESVMRGLLSVGESSANETLWYQTRDGTAMMVAEAIFIDEVNNQELACFKFSEFETPNFRGRLPDAPYRPISLE